MSTSTARERAKRFCERFGLTAPILEAPMAGANSVARSAAIADAGAMAAMGALLSTPAQIREWASAVRARSNGAFQINLWIPDPAPVRDLASEAATRAFLAQWGPTVPPEAGDTTPPDFAAQCEALLDAGPAVISTIMGLFPPTFVAQLKARHVAWFATATTLAEARAAAQAGADAIIAQSFEAGGHRGAFDAAMAENQAVGAMALIPRLADQLALPIVAAGGIADGRQLAAALTLGASAVQIGTAFLRTKEAETPRAWVAALGSVEPEGTMPTRTFSGRLGRAIASPYVRAAAAPGSPKPAPYPVQRALTARMREEATRTGDADRMQLWAGQSAFLAREEPAGEVVRRIWDEAQRLLP